MPFTGGQGLALHGTLLCPPCPGAHSFLLRRLPTSRLVKLQGDVGIKAQAEVVVEDIEGQLECQGTEMRAGLTDSLPLLGLPQWPLRSLSPSAFRAFSPREQYAKVLPHSAQPTPAGRLSPPSSSEHCWIPLALYPTHHVLMRGGDYLIHCLEQCLAHSSSSVCARWLNKKKIL